MRRFVALSAAALVFGLIWSHQPGARAAVTNDGGVLRVFFIGNSYTRFNNLPRLVRKAADAYEASFDTNRVAWPGYTLAMHWKRGDALEQLNRKHPTHVVLQGHSLDPITQPDLFAHYAGKFARAAKARGAQLVLYQTWARHPRHRFYRRNESVHNPEQMQAAVADVYARLADSLGAKVAPVGDAWARSLRIAPHIALHTQDGSHPTLAGSYLAACVLHATITGRDPRHIDYKPHELSPAEVEHLRSVAAAAVASR